MARHTWLAVIVAAFAFLFWINSVRIARVDYVTGLVATGAAADPGSATGYRGGVRRMIIPERNTESYQWIAQTQQMLATGEWRIRHVDYDNAPNGRDVRTPSPYRWWLAFVATCDRLLSGRAQGTAVERAALFADPILHGLLLLGVTVYVVRRFDTLHAAVLAIAIAAAFPLGGLFLPGQPDDDSLLAICVLWTVLPLMTIAGTRPGSLPTIAAMERDAARLRRAFSLSGVAGGLALWVNAPRAGVVVAGIALGGMAVALLRRRAVGDEAAIPAELPWRRWAVCGAVTGAAAFLVEYAPSHLGGLHLEQVHPLHSLAWLGAGELLRLAQRRIAPFDRKAWTTLGVAALATCTAPALMLFTASPAFVNDDPLADRLSGLPAGPVATSFADWVMRDGLTGAVWTAVLPAIVIVALAAWLAVRTAANPRRRTALLIATGPVLALLALACFQIRAWNLVNVTLWCLAVAVLLALARVSAAARWIGAGAIASLWIPGLWLVTADAGEGRRRTASEEDLQALIERDLAHWLANQSGDAGAVVLAPPQLTASLSYLGGLRGIVTPNLENRNGFYAAVRIMAATSPDEAQALANSRGVTHIVIPTWDATLSEFARIGAQQPEQALASLLSQWRPPRWLRPLPYPMPQVGGFEGSNVFIFQVVEEVQDNQTALSRLAEYFLEMGEVRSAMSIADVLEKSFPGDLTALTARAHVDLVSRDAGALAATLAAIDAALTNGADEFLPWERRVSLALALAQARRADQARKMVVSCLEQADAGQLRFLTTGTLYRLVAYCGTAGVAFPDPALRDTALALLPLELRERLQAAANPASRQ